MPNSDSSEEEFHRRRPKHVENSSRNLSIDNSEALTNSQSVRIEPLSPDVLRIWSELPEAIRLDPSLLAYKKEYEKMSGQMGAGTSKNVPLEDCLILNLSITKRRKFEDEDDEVPLLEKTYSQKKSKFRYAKLFALTFFWITSTVILMMTSERVEIFRQISISQKEKLFLDTPKNNRIDVTVEGSFYPLHSKGVNNSEETNNYVTLWLELCPNGYVNQTQMKNAINISDPWTVQLLPFELIDVFPPEIRKHEFTLKPFNSSLLKNNTVALNFQTTYNRSFPISVAYNLSPINVEDGIIYAAGILLGLYVLIVFEIVHRTLAAMVASTMSLAILAAMNEKPAMGELISWINVDTLLLLFSMMILVIIFSDTGVFDFLAVYAFKITGGKKWPLLNTLCFFTAFMSAFLDNVTTVLLMTPVTIRLCEVMHLNPVPILTIMVFYSNIGGALTPVGDPPNVIIMARKEIKEAGIEFGLFTVHMFIGTFIITIIIYIKLRLIFRHAKSFQYDEPNDVQELRQKINIWQRAAASLSNYNKYECEVKSTLTKKVNNMFSELNKKILSKSDIFEDYQSTLEDLQRKYPIRDMWLLFKSGCALTFVIILFFLHSVPELNLTLGWTAFLGALLLLLVAEDIDFDGLMARIEWGTLSFFASLFILMEVALTGNVKISMRLKKLPTNPKSLEELQDLLDNFKLTLSGEQFLLYNSFNDPECEARRENLRKLMKCEGWFLDETFKALAKLGLIAWIGQQTEKVILSVDEESRLAVAILLLLWVSAFASAFVDNVPLTTMMVRIAIRLAENRKLGLPLQPLVWALAFGASMGGNGTLIGATANVVCAGVAEQHGHRFTFMQFFKIGFPVMITSTTTAMIYLLVAHVMFQWNG